MFQVLPTYPEFHSFHRRFLHNIRHLASIDYIWLVYTHLKGSDVIGSKIRTELWNRALWRQKWTNTYWEKLEVEDFMAGNLGTVGKQLVHAVDRRKFYSVNSSNPNNFRK